MAEIARIRGLAVPDSNLVIDADLDLAAGAAVRRRIISIEEICGELLRLVPDGNAGRDVIELSAELAAAALATFPFVRQATITVWNRQPVLDMAGAESVGATTSAERKKNAARQGDSLTRPRPR